MDDLIFEIAAQAGGTIGVIWAFLHGLKGDVAEIKKGISSHERRLSYLEGYAAGNGDRNRQKDS